MRNSKALTGLLSALVLVAVGCTSGEADTTTSTEISEPTTTVAPATTETLPPTTAVAAPTTTTEAAADPLIVWTDDTGAAVLAGVAADFEADTGVPVVIELVDFEDIREQALTADQARYGPDVFMGDHDWLGELTARGAVAEIDLPYSASFFAIALTAFSIDGNLYGVPFAVEGMALLRNTDLVPEGSDSFAELAASCEALAGAIEQCLGFPPGDAYAAQALIHGFGGYLFGHADDRLDTTDVGLDGEGALAAADFIDAQVTAGLLDPNIGVAEATDLFTDGVEPYLWGGIEELHLAQAAGIPVAATPLPAIDGDIPAPFIEVDGFMISAFSKQPVVAQAFVTEYLSSETVMFDLYEGSSRGPAHQAAFALAIAHNPSVEAFTPVGADPRYLLPGIPELDEVLAALDAALSLIWSQDIDQLDSPRDAFQQAAETVRDILADS